MYAHYSEHQSRGGTGRPGIEVANDEIYLNILGPPGAGKTTFLKRVGLEALLPRREWIHLPNFSDLSGLVESAFGHSCIPVFIELRKFGGGPIDLRMMINAEFQICGFPESEHFVDGALGRGRLLILLDGLDEVPSENLDAVIAHIRDFADRFHKNRFITSCRTAFYKTYFGKFRDVELAPFDDTQVRMFAANWFRTERAVTNDFLGELFRDEHRSTLTLARTPLLLTFLCLVFDSTQKFPHNRAILYRDALLILLERWAAEKRVHSDPIYKDLHTDLEIELLSEIAGGAFLTDELFFSEQQLLDSISYFMKQTLGAPRTLNSRRILTAIEVQQGLLVQRAADVFSFSHLTIQEYLTAHYFNSAARMKVLCENHLFDRKWREVFLLLAGITRADELLVLLVDQLAGYMRSNRRVGRYVEWASRVTKPGNDSQESAARRAYVLSLALRFKHSGSQGSIADFEVPADELMFILSPRFARSHKTPRSVSITRILPLIHELERLDIVKGGLSKVRASFERMIENKPRNLDRTTEREAFNRRLLDVLYDTLGLDDDLRNLGGTLRLLVFYLEACKLIVECKNAASRVSSNVWDTVCRSIVSTP